VSSAGGSARVLLGVGLRRQAHRLTRGGAHALAVDHGPVAGVALERVRVGLTRLSSFKVAKAIKNCKLASQE